MFDYYPEIDVQREVFDAGKSRLADARTIMIVEPLANVLVRGRRLRVAASSFPTKTTR